MSDTTDPILTTLIATHALLAEGPERWTRGSLARDGDGNEVEYNDRRATCFCLSGAIGLVSPDEAAWTASVDYIEFRFHIYPVPFNDDPATTYEMILDVLVRSIAARREEIGGGI